MKTDEIEKKYKSKLLKKKTHTYTHKAGKNITTEPRLENKLNVATRDVFHSLCTRKDNEIKGFFLLRQTYY